MRLHVLRLYVADLERSATFWRAALAIGPEVEGAGGVLFRTGRILVGLHPAEGRPEPGAVTLSFEVDDLEAATARLVEAGGRAIAAPRSRGEVRESLVLDPDGHRIELHQWLR